MNRLLARSIVALFTVAVAVLAPHPAFADEPRDKSAALRAEGNRLMDERKYDDALARYEEAQKLTPDDAAIFYNLSRIHELRGDAVAALENMERFVEKAAPDLKRRVGNVDQVLAELRSRVTAVHLECSAPPLATAGDTAARALILANGRVVANGCRDQDVRLKAGRTELRAEADGYVGRRIDVDLVGGQRATVRVELAPRDTSGLLRLTSDPDHATVTSDGRDLGATPVEVALSAGTHRLMFQADGHEPLELSIVVEANKTKELPLVHLDKKPSVLTRWWFWTGVGAVVAGGVALTVALTTERSPDTGTIPPGTTKLPLMRW